MHLSVWFCCVCLRQSFLAPHLTLVQIPVCDGPGKCWCMALLNLLEQIVLHYNEVDQWWYSSTDCSLLLHWHRPNWSSVTDDTGLLSQLLLLRLSFSLSLYQSHVSPFIRSHSVSAIPPTALPSSVVGLHMFLLHMVAFYQCSIQVSRWIGHMSERQDGELKKTGFGS